jgi:hypothetical protein
MLLVCITGTALAVEEQDLQFGPGWDVDSIITIASSILATVLFVITLVAYKRDGRKRILFVSTAFLLFAIKGFLSASDVFIGSKAAWVDPVANILDLAVLLCFFIGIIKK